MKKIFKATGISWGYVAMLITLSFVILLAPLLAILILVLLIMLVVLLEGMKLKLWLGFRERSDKAVNTDTPLVSVHLAICNEPPSMVISTVKGILAQDYPNFELIVIDNNTVDSSLWEPVADFSRNLSNVRFFHLDKWPFYKSGALNFARKVSDSKAEFIFVIDADYRLTPDALSLAVANVEGPDIALVQFPQAYECKKEKHVQIIEEFDHFFDYYCSKADSCYGALATGTLSLIRIASLDGVGGWPVNSITEDAELGARLQVAGYDIKYVHRIIGKGIAPVHQQDFIKQRKRWIFGNMQTLRNYSMRPWNNFHKWLSGVSQLTAWANLLGFPILILLCCLFLGPWLSYETFVSLSALAYFGYWTFAFSAVLRMQLVQGRPSLMAFRTFLIHFSSLDIGAFYWWPVILGRARPFVRTDKTGINESYRLNVFYPFLHISLVFMAISSGSIFVGVSALTFAMLHILAMRFDYICRSEYDSNILLNLKLYL
ncbi:MAG: glycosyltransferase family 2 protein [Pricia sp.]